MTLIESTNATLSTLRKEARALLNEFDVADALASYYALHHEPKRTTLVISRREGEVNGMVARCMTGIDLFRPVITLRLRGQNALPAILHKALVPGRPYLLIVPESYVTRLEPHLQLSGLSTNLLLRLDPAQFTPQMNALVVETTAPDGTPRTEIRREEQVVGAAGVNWVSPLFAEVYVTVNEQHRLKGLGRSLLTTLIATLIKRQVTPLYTVDVTNQPSLALAKSVGFVETGAREVMGTAMLGG
jgi:hypothetical protein